MNAKNTTTLSAKEKETLDLEKLNKEDSIIEFIKKQNPEFLLSVVKLNGMALQFVKEQTEELCLAAVEENGLALQFVENQTEQICLAAVIQDGLALQFVKEQTEKNCSAALNQNKDAAQYIKYETIHKTISTLDKSMFFKWLNNIKIDELDDEDCLEVICKIKYINGLCDQPYNMISFAFINEKNKLDTYCYSLNLYETNFNQFRFLYIDIYNNLKFKNDMVYTPKKMLSVILQNTTY